MTKESETTTSKLEFDNEENNMESWSEKISKCLIFDVL
jgi:hypothetical protein